MHFLSFIAKRHVIVGDCYGDRVQFLDIFFYLWTDLIETWKIFFKSDDLT